MAVIPKRRRRNPTGTMTLMEHLGELRTRLIICMLALLVAAIPAWFLYGPVFTFLSNPFCSFMTAHPTLAANPAHPCNLYWNSPVEPFLVKVKVVSVLALGIALPVVLYEGWRFITPGLTSRERRYSVPFVLSSMVLFGLGAAFALFTLPKALNFLLGFAGTIRVALILSVAKYLGFTLLLILAFGVSFEFPLLLIFLMMVGVLSSRRLLQWQRYAVVGIAVFAAVITPSQDWFTMSAMMVPLIVFYYLAILVGRFILKK
ncbi:MAG TPA: twin-arginine translocase subunit TatC [Actinomycetota bacterium]